MGEFKKHVLDPMDSEPVIGYPIGLPRLQRAIGGCRQESIILIGSSSGVGKTAFTDKAYVLEPYDFYIKNREELDLDFHTIYYSMERSKRFKLQKWACYRLFKEHKIVCDVATLNQWSNKLYLLSDDLRQKIRDLEEYFEEMEEHVTIIDGPINPTGIYNEVNEYAKSIANVFQVSTKINSKGFEYKEFNYKRKPEKVKTQVNIIIDNVDNLMTEKSKETGTSMTEKERKDKMTQYMQMFRDRYSFTCIPISQFNRSLGNVLRMKAKSVVEPEPDDFKGTGNLYDAADIVLAPFNPIKLKVESYLGFNLKKFRAEYNGTNRFRGLVVLKNSYGPDDLSLALNFLGECGEFREIERFIESRPTDYHYYTWANYHSFKYPEWKFPGIDVELN